MRASETLHPQTRAFADACSTRSVDALETALLGPADSLDCETWDISEADWRHAIMTALHERATAGAK